MKILLVTEFFPTGKDLKFSGGVEARTFFVAKHLAKKHQVLVICSRQTGTKIIEKMYGLTIYRVGPENKYSAGAPRFSDFNNGFKNTKFIFSAIRLGRKLESDIVDGGNFIGHFIAKQISEEAKIPVVFWYPDVFIGQWIKTSGIAGISGWLLEKFNLLRSADHFIAISKITAQKLQVNGVSQGKISVIPCGVDLNEFRFKVNKSTIPSIICISRLVHYKRISDLIWAFAILLKKNNNLTLKIIGRGPEEKKLKDICKMLRISAKVLFVNNLIRKDLIRSIKSSHILCLPSEVEGFGLSVIESAAAGIPYVISDIEVFKEISKNGHGGLIFQVGNVRDLSSKIEKLLLDKNLYQKKSREALDLAKNYQWSQIANQTEALYKSLFSKNTQLHKSGLQ